MPKTTPSHDQRRFPVAKTLALAVAACFAVPAWATLPGGATHQCPTCVFTTVTGNTLTLTSTQNRTITSWQDFSVGAGNSVVFNQPNSSSAWLNRVTGGNESRILGNITSNGQVWLINPAGIFIGRDATINTARFLASTLDILDEDFLNNRMRFLHNPDAGRVVNDGTITTPTGGAVYLIGADVENNGLIKTPQGETYLVAGQSVDFGDTSTPGVTVTFTANGNEALNVGRIVAESGQIGLLGAVIKQRGVLNAASTVREGGRIFLRAKQSIDVASTGIMDASGTSGGRISLDSDGTTQVTGQAKARGTSTGGGQVDILGDRVALMGQATVDASGNTGGGTVRVGGDYQGSNPAVRNAAVTHVGSGVKIKADALRRGNGGRVIVWSDNTTRYYGALSARGGFYGGDGGFAEVSGKHYLDYRGLADLRAPRGQVGSLLLDPGDVDILAGTGASVDINVIGGGQFDAVTTGAASSLYWNTINTQLGLSDVRITAQAGGGYTGDIKFNPGSYVSTSTKTLWLLAEGAVTFNQADVDLAGNLQAYAGWVPASGLTNPLVAASPSDILFTTTGSNFVRANNMVLRSGDAIVQSAGYSLRVPSLLDAKAENTITLTDGNNLLRDVRLTAGGNIDLMNNNTVLHVQDASSLAGSIDITSAGDIGLGLVSAPAGNVTITAQGKILDDNGTFTTNVIGSLVTLTSQNGAGAAGFLAISADVDTTDVIAVVSGGSYGGIDIRQMNGANPMNQVVLQDNSTTSGYGNIRFQTKGALPLANGGFFIFDAPKGSIDIGAEGNVDITAGGGTFNAEGPIRIGSLQNLTVDNSGLVATTTHLQLGAAGTNTIDGDITVTGVVTPGGTIGDLSIGGGQTFVGVGGSAMLTAADGDIRIGGGLVRLGTLGATSAKNVSLGGGQVIVEGTAQATFNVNVNAGTSLEVISGGVIDAGNNAYVVTNGNIILNGGQIVASNDVSLELNGADSEIRFYGGDGVFANMGGGAGLVKVAFNARAADGILMDDLPVVFSSASSSGFQNNGSTAIPGFGMELLYKGGYTAITSTLSGCHFRGGCEQYNATKYADISIEESFTLFKEETAGGGAGEFGGQDGDPRQKKAKKPGRCS